MYVNTHQATSCMYVCIYIYIYICIIFRCTRVMSSSTIRVLKRQNSVTTAEYKQTDGTGLHLEHLLLLRVKCFLRSHYKATAKSNGYNRRKQNNKYYRRSACRMVHGASVPLIKLCLQHVKCATKTYQIRTVFSRNVLECLQPEISSFLSFRVDTMRVPQCQPFFDGMGKWNSHSISIFRFSFSYDIEKQI